MKIEILLYFFFQLIITLTFDTKLARYAARAFKYSFLAASVFFLYTWNWKEKKKQVYIITCVKRQSMQPTCFTSTKHKSEDTNFNRCHLNIVVGNKNEIMVIVGVAAMREGGIVHLLTHLLGAWFITVIKYVLQLKLHRRCYIYAWCTWNCITYFEKVIWEYRKWDRF